MFFLKNNNYLMMHSTRLDGVGHMVKVHVSIRYLLFQSWSTARTINSSMEGRKEMFLFHNALSTFYLRLYGVGHMVKNHSDSERGNPLPPHGLLSPINSKGSFICTIPVRIAHNTASVVDHWLEREIAQWVHHEGSIRRLVAL